MGGHTKFDAEKAAAAEQLVRAGKEQFYAAREKLRAASERFHAAAGDDEKDGDLVSQSDKSVAAMASRAQAVEKHADKNADASAFSQANYTGTDSGNAHDIGAAH